MRDITRRKFKHQNVVKLHQGKARIRKLLRWWLAFLPVFMKEALYFLDEKLH
jgi:hypothetical protein